MDTKHVVAAVIVRDGRILATARGYGDFRGWWEFPGGKIESGESDAQALRREIREELGAEIAVGEMLASVEYDYPKFHLSMHCYVCTLVSESFHLLEHEDARWLAKDELMSVKWLPADIEVVSVIGNKVL